MHSHDPILQQCRSVLEEFYGERLKGLVLYGSAARGTDVPENDIDLMVLLDGPVNAALEIRRIWDVLYAVQLKSDRLISVMPADAEDYDNGAYCLYRTVRQEGVPV